MLILTFPTTSYADWSTGNPILDAIRVVISIKNTSEKIANTDFKKQGEKVVVNVVESVASDYEEEQAEANFNQHKQNVIGN